MAFFLVPDLAFTNSANRTVINSAIASTSQLSGGQSRHRLPRRWGFCSFISHAITLRVINNAA
jgi:hypothetical protein